MCRNPVLDKEIDPWAASTRVNRIALAIRPRSYQHDLFKEEPFSAWASHWVRIVARSVNAELPARSREAGVPLAPLPVEDLVAYVRKGRCPDPTDPMLLVPARVWALFLAAVSNPNVRPNALCDREQERLLQYMGELANYARYLFENAKSDPIARQIGLHTRALTYNNIQSWYVPLPPLLRRELTQPGAYNLIRAARAELLMRLARPVTRMSTGDDVVRVQFAGLVEYVADAKRREIYVEVLNEFDQMQRIEGALDLYRPLATDFWLDTFLDHWLLRWAPPVSLKVHRVLRAWIRSCLCREIGRASLRPMLRRALLEGFRFVSLVKPEVARMTMLALSPGRKHALLNSHFNRSWQELDRLQQIERESPQLLHLYQLARQRGQLTAGAGIDDLKALMRDHGVTQGGWNLLCRFGPEIYKGALQAKAFDPRVEAVAAHVELFQRVDLERCPPRSLQRALYVADFLPLIEITRLPPQFVRHAWAELNRHEQGGTEDFFIREEFMPILWWIRVNPPEFDKNQLKAGWGFWVGAYIRWTQEQRDIAKGKPWTRLVEVGTIDYGPYVAVPITSIVGLIDEAEAMHHCVAEYHDRCRTGEYLVFSIRERAGWKRAATLGLILTETVWGIDQLSGYANKVAGLSLRRMASAVTDKINAVSWKPQSVRRAA